MGVWGRGSPHLNHIKFRPARLQRSGHLRHILAALCTKPLMTILDSWMQSRISKAYQWFLCPSGIHQLDKTTPCPPPQGPKKHSYMQPLKYCLVPHEEKWYAQSKNEVTTLQIIPITKPHNYISIKGLYCSFFLPFSSEHLTKLGTNRLRQWMKRNKNTQKKSYTKNATVIS